VEVLSADRYDPQAEPETVEPREVWDRELDEVREFASLPRAERGTFVAPWARRALEGTLPASAHGARAYLAREEVQ
jgi:hypothetical protein